MNFLLCKTIRGMICCLKWMLCEWMSVTVVSQTTCCDETINQLDLQSRERWKKNLVNSNSGQTRLASPSHVRDWGGNCFICRILKSWLMFCSLPFWVCWASRHKPTEGKTLLSRHVLNLFSCIFLQLQGSKTILVLHRMHPSSRQSFCQHRTYWTAYGPFPFHLPPNYFQFMRQTQ